MVPSRLASSFASLGGLRRQAQQPPAALLLLLATLVCGSLALKERDNAHQVWHFNIANAAHNSALGITGSSACASVPCCHHHFLPPVLHVLVRGRAATATAWGSSSQATRTGSPRHPSQQQPRRCRRLATRLLRSGVSPQQKHTRRVGPGAGSPFRALKPTPQASGRGDQAGLARKERHLGWRGSREAWEQPQLGETTNES